MDKKVEILSRETVHTGFYPKIVLHVRYRRFDGGMSDVASRDMLEQGLAAVVLPYDPATDRVLLIEQFRPAPLMMGDDPWMLEAVAGRTEKGEDAADTARREALEEAGVDLADLVVAADGNYPSPGCLMERTTIFVGRCDLSGVAPGVHGLDVEGEDIRTHVMPFADALAAAESGRLRSMPAVLAVLWLATKREGLRRRWS